MGCDILEKTNHGPVKYVPDEFVNALAELIDVLGTHLKTCE
jgi:hypothetical protein